MKYDVLIFVAMVITLAASGVHALRSAQGDLNASRSIILEGQPISERVALLERDFEYLSESVEEIKQLIQEQNDKTMQWIIMIIGLLITGDRGLSILQKVRNNRKGK
jgi:hypothetical protein